MGVCSKWSSIKNITEKVKRVKQIIDVTDNDSDYNMAMIYHISPTKDSKVKMQKQFFINEETGKKENYFRSFHGIDIEYVFMDY